jgi:hypothetical protein
MAMQMRTSTFLVILISFLSAGAIVLLSLPIQISVKVPGEGISANEVIPIHLSGTPWKIHTKLLPSQIPLQFEIINLSGSEVHLARPFGADGQRLSVAIFTDYKGAGTWTPSGDRMVSKQKGEILKFMLNEEITTLDFPKAKWAGQVLIKAENRERIVPLMSEQDGWALIPARSSSSDFLISADFGIAGAKLTYSGPPIAGVTAGTFGKSVSFTSTVSKNDGKISEVNIQIPAGAVIQAVLQNFGLLMTLVASGTVIATLLCIMGLKFQEDGLFLPFLLSVASLLTSYFGTILLT